MRALGHVSVYILKVGAPKTVAAPPLAFRPIGLLSRDLYLFLRRERGTVDKDYSNSATGTARKKVGDLFHDPFII